MKSQFSQRFFHSKTNWFLTTFSQWGVNSSNMPVHHFLFAESLELMFPLDKLWYVDTGHQLQLMWSQWCDCWFECFWNCWSPGFSRITVKTILLGIMSTELLLAGAFFVLGPFLEKPNNKKPTHSPFLSNCKKVLIGKEANIQNKYKTVRLWHLDGT